MTSDHRAGFVAVIGRPNVGKSTLVNALVGRKIVITSSHPNTTRNPIRGIISRPYFQMILVDTPGIHKPKTLLGTRLNAMVQENLESVDAALLCLPADEAIGAGDEYIVKQLGHIRHLYIAVTKVDLSKQEQLISKLTEVSNFIDKTGIIDTDQAAELHITELIREAAIQDLYEELPHSVMVTIEEMSKREGKNFFDIHATIHVERDSQKSIIIGPQGSRLKDIGMRARASIETFLDAKSYLGLHVKVSKEWQRDPKALARLGFTE